MSLRVFPWFYLGFEQVLINSVKLHLIVCLSVVFRECQILGGAGMEIGSVGRSMEEEIRDGAGKGLTARAVSSYGSSGGKAGSTQSTAKIPIFRRPGAECTA